MQKLRRPPEFIEQALSKARQRGSRTLKEEAAELNVSVHTLKGWLQESRSSKASSLPQSLPGGQWSARERLLALQESHGLSGEALQAWQSGGQGEAVRAVARPGDIRMLSSLSCVYCTRARAWMTEQRVPFTECFIEQDPACAAEFHAHGGRGTPTMLVHGQAITGFDRQQVLVAMSAD